MTNAIEQTRREMYNALELLRGHRPPAYFFDNFEGHLEAHLEELRKGMAALAEALKIATAHKFELIEERDTLRNKLQALQMASSTAAEVIRGLRSELEEAREGISKPVANDIYMMGFNSLGKTSCPYQTNTIERLHWVDGDRERRDLLDRIVENCKVPK